MDRKTVSVIFLVLALGVVTYFAFQSNQLSQSEIPLAGAIPPTQELRTAYENSSQHSAMADIAELSCLPTSRFDCSNGSCVAAAPGSYFFVDYGTESGTYFRCDAKGCDPYLIDVHQSGQFTQFIPSQGQAMFFKVETGDILGNKGDFLDVATIGTSAIVSTGKCEFKR